MALGEEEFLNFPIGRGRVLFISLDMRENACQTRLHQVQDQFVPAFRFVFSDVRVDCLARKFNQTDIYIGVREMLAEGSYDLIMIDCLRNLGSFEMNNDDVPDQVYGSLKEWLPGQTILITHHARKQGREYVLTEQTIEDAFGSGYWTNLAPSVLVLQQTNGEMGKLTHVKSQLGLAGDDRKVCVDPYTSTLRLWDEHKARAVERDMAMWVEKAKAKCGETWATMRVNAKVEVVAKIAEAAPRTIYSHLKTMNMSWAEFEDHCK